MARGPREREKDREQEERDSEFVEKLVHINRVAKAVKGGRRFGFAALMVVGDQKGRVGFGHGKAREVPEAIRKATEEAKELRARAAARGPHAAPRRLGRHGAGKVMLRAAPPGTGIIAGGPMRAVLETLGVQDVVAKSIGSSNPYNMVRATFDALKHQDSPRSVAARRNKGVRVCRRAAATAMASRRRPSNGEAQGRHEQGDQDGKTHRVARPAARSAARTTSAPPWSAWASTGSAASRRWRTRRRCAA